MHCKSGIQVNLYGYVQDKKGNLFSGINWKDRQKIVLQYWETRKFIENKLLELK